MLCVPTVGTDKAIGESMKFILLRVRGSTIQFLVSPHHWSLEFPDAEVYSSLRAATSASNNHGLRAPRSEIHDYTLDGSDTESLICRL